MNRQSIASRYSNRGFTLIEMLVVVAIIAVLAGIVIAGLGTFQASARDSRRIADIKVIHNYLEVYNSIKGSYPHPSTTTWAGLQNELRTAIPNLVIPVDPVNNGTYGYVYTTDAAGSKYVLGANLEKDNRVLSQDKDGSHLVGATDKKYYSSSNWSTCDDTATLHRYCISS